MTAYRDLIADTGRFLTFSAGAATIGYRMREAPASRRAKQPRSCGTRGRGRRCWLSLMQIAVPRVSTKASALLDQPGHQPAELVEGTIGRENHHSAFGGPLDDTLLGFDHRLVFANAFSKTTICCFDCSSVA